MRFWSDSPTPAIHYHLRFCPAQIMDSPAQTAMLDHANGAFFAAIDLASQEKHEEAIAKFEQAIHLFSILAASTYRVLTLFILRK